MSKRWGDIALKNNMANPERPADPVDFTAVTRLTPPAAAAWLAEHPAPMPASQAIVLPLPPSTNDNWDNYNGRTVLSEEAKNFRAVVKYLGNFHDLRPYDGPVAVYVRLYCANALQDLDNYDGKALLDALQGVLFVNDRQVIERHSWRHDDYANPRVEVEVRQVTV